MAAEIHVGDTTVFRVSVKDEDGAIIDTSAASTKQIWFRKPDGSVLTKTAAHYTDGSDGIMQYTATTSDLDAAGKWRIQGYVVIGSLTIHTDISEFKVFANLQ